VLVLLVFLALQWQASVFFQSFFLHRYAAHGQFTMSRRWERVFHVLTWLTMGASYLSPRAYAALHRMHHAYSDTAKDPHSPSYRRFFPMMWHTARFYGDLRRGKVAPEARFAGPTPSWPLFDDKLLSWPGVLCWGAAYTLVYIAFATEWWMFLLLPVHYLMGPIHGAIVNYCGHKFGYRNFETRDRSRNTLPFDVLTMGELFQNNHHRSPMSPNFASRWFAIDPAYAIMRVFAAFGIIDLRSARVTARPSPKSCILQVSLAKSDRSAPLVTGRLHAAPAAWSRSSELARETPDAASRRRALPS
jgi:stearoyl-CoA desaturase (Delta-9 desaturase)